MHLHTTTKYTYFFDSKWLYPTTTFSIEGKTPMHHENRIFDIPKKRSFGIYFCTMKTHEASITLTCAMQYNIITLNIFDSQNIVNLSLLTSQNAWKSTKKSTILDSVKSSKTSVICIFSCKTTHTNLHRQKYEKISCNMISCKSQNFDFFWIKTSIWSGKPRI